MKKPEIESLEHRIRGFAKRGDLFYTKHVIEQGVKGGISPEEVEETLSAGEIIEFYEKDLPFPSCLVLTHLYHRPT